MFFDIVFRTLNLMILSRPFKTRPLMYKSMEITGEYQGYYVLIFVIIPNY